MDAAYGNGGGIGLGTVRNSNSNDQNPEKLFDMIVDAATMTVNSQEKVTSDYIFVRARNSQYNYSENPSFITGSTGDVLYTDFINAPQTFITTVGLYNDSNDLLAVAKLSKPLKKDFTKEALIRVKLDFWWMSYLKGLTSKDVIVSPLTVHKTFTRNGNPPSFTNSLNTPIDRDWETHSSEV